MLAGHQRESAALRTCDHHQGPPGRHFRDAHVPLLRQADHGVAIQLELLQGTIEIDDPGHGQVFEGAGCHLCHSARQAGIAALGDDHAVGSQGFSGAHNRSQVVGIGDAVNSHHQGRLTDAPAELQQFIEVQGGRRGRLQHDALVHRTSAELNQACPGDLLDHHTGSLGFPQQLHETGREAQLRSAPDAVDGPIAAQHRLRRVAPPDEIVSEAGIIRPGRSEPMGPGIRGLITALEATTVPLASALEATRSAAVTTIPPAFTAGLWPEATPVRAREASPRAVITAQVVALPMAPLVAAAVVRAATGPFIGAAVLVPTAAAISSETILLAAVPTLRGRAAEAITAIPFTLTTAAIALALAPAPVMGTATSTGREAAVIRLAIAATSGCVGAVPAPGAASGGAAAVTAPTSRGEAIVSAATAGRRSHAEGAASEDVFSASSMANSRLSRSGR